MDWKTNGGRFANAEPEPRDGYEGHQPDPLSTTHPVALPLMPEAIETAFATAGPAETRRLRHRAAAGVT
jgi:hypothetical protein